MSNTPASKTTQKSDDEQLQESKKLYEWNDDGPYPPHVSKVPEPPVRKLKLEIFRIQPLLQTKGMLGLTEAVMSTQYTSLVPGDKISVDGLVDFNQLKRAPPGVNDHMLFPWNIGDRKNKDWFSDAVFAQQHFTGTNATTITLAGDDWVARFTESANEAQNEGILKILKSSAACLYVQDYSYFRTAMRFSADQDIKSDDGRYGAAPVALFHLGADGILHPLAIVIDYKGSMAASVVIFNKRLTPGSGTLAEEAEDWPWRYAKTCVQSADWLRHEVSIHLVNTHLVEEACIVAANRTIPKSHIVYQLLEKHWETTLSLNDDARNVLVPAVIARIAPVEKKPLFAFLKHAYMTFDWKKLRIPQDLEERGFPSAELNDPKYHNYAYARNMALMWRAIHSFVEAVLRQSYKGDEDVEKDQRIQDFCNEMRSWQGANMPTFPEIKTLDELIDTVTMCIHIASPQHTAVNYLQQYYQVFVPNKPWALYQPLPKSYDELLGYKQEHLRDALPFKQTNHWLMGAQLAYLLSSEPSSDSSLLTYANQQSKNSDQAIAVPAKSFETDLIALQGEFKKHSDALDDKETIYSVMDPAVTAVSILI